MSVNIDQVQGETGQPAVVLITGTAAVYYSLFVHNTLVPCAIYYRNLDALI